MTEISAAGSLSPTTIEPTRPTISRNPSAGGLEAKPAKKDFLSRRVAVTVTAIVVLGLAVSTSWWLFSRKRQTLTEKDAIVLADFTNQPEMRSLTTRSSKLWPLRSNNLHS